LADELNNHSSDEEQPSPSNIDEDSLNEKLNTVNDDEELALFESELERLAASVPIIPPMKAHPAITALTFLTLLIFGIMGLGPNAALKVSPSKNVLTDGEAIPAEAGLDYNWRHRIKSDDLEIAFDYLGRITDVSATGHESGVEAPKLDILKNGQHFRLRIMNEDDYEDSSEGRIRSFRTLKNGLLTRREFLDGMLQLDTTIILGKDENDQDRRYLDVILEFKNMTEESYGFGYTINVIDNLTLPIRDLSNVSAVSLGKDEKGEDIVERVTYASEHSGHFREPKALALITRYGLVALAQINPDPENGRLRGEVPIGASPDGVDVGMKMIQERLRIKKKGSLRHHFRLVVGPKSAWTLNGHENPDLKTLTNNSYIGSHYTRDLELSFLRGFLNVIPQQGLALMLIGILTAMLLRPISLSSAWSSLRMASLKPLCMHINQRRAEMVRTLGSYPMRRKAREMASLKVTQLYKAHKIQPGLGCLMWILILPVLFGFYDAIETGYALRDAQFLWIKDMASPDNFYPLLEPLIEIDFFKLLVNDPQGQPAYDLNYRVDSIHLLPILLYTLPWLETIILRMMGVKAPFRIFSTLIFFAVFMLLFYNLPAGAHLGFLTVRLVWATDRIRLFRYLQKSHQKPAAPKQQDSEKFNEHN
jgi:membrane protein insertase Oxa1/YidC/SpoIIIJ